MPPLFRPERSSEVLAHSIVGSEGGLVSRRVLERPYRHVRDALPGRMVPAVYRFVCACVCVGGGGALHAVRLAKRALVQAEVPGSMYYRLMGKVTKLVVCKFH